MTQRQHTAAFPVPVRFARIGQFASPLPRLSVPIIDRARLAKRLDSGRPLTVLCAPSGFGKTTLVAHWLTHQRDDQRLAAWVRAPATADPAEFWSTFGRVLSDAGSPMPLPLDRVSRADIAAALQLPGPEVLVVVDELDRVSDPGIGEELIDMVRESSKLRLVVCVRAHHTIAAHRAMGIDASVISAGELLFTRAETHQLARAMSATVPPPVADEIHRECDGWPVLTRAVLLALIDSPEPPRPEAVPEITRNLATDYVWSRLPPRATSHEDLTFALLSAVPDELTVDIASTFSSSPAESRLDTLVAKGLLAVDTSHGEEVYRWPAPIRPVLLRELRRRHPEQLHDLYRSLASVHVDRGEPAAALRHASAAGDWPLVVQIIDSSWRTLLVRHREELYRAVAAVPLQDLRTSRRASATRDIVVQPPPDRLLSTDNLPMAPAELDELARQPDAGHTLETALAVQVALRNQSPLGLVGDYSRRLLYLARAIRAAQPEQVTDLYPSVLIQVGLALTDADDFAGAIDALREAHDRAPDSCFQYVAPEAAAHLALIHAIDGSLARADLWARRAEAAPRPGDWLGEFIDPVPRTARLLSALHRLDVAAAAAQERAIVRHRYVERSWAFQIYARAVLALHLGSAADALESLTGEEADYEDRHSAGSTWAPLLAEAQADLLLSLGRGNLARSVLYGPYAGHPRLRVGQARLELLTGNSEQARRLAADAQWESAASRRHRHEMSLIHALAARRVGDDQSAVKSLRRAALASRTTGVLRPFTTVPRGELLELAEQLPLAAELMADARLASHPDLFPEQITVVTLTRREQLVLEKLAAGLTLQQTADALVVSYNTIRSQQASVYRKLGAESRLDAIARARQWGLF